MSHVARFFWGLLAGLAIVCVKIMGPDQSHVGSLFVSGTLGAIGFYVFLSIITVVLGGISGLFSEEKSPGKLLVFAASFPAMISTLLAQETLPLSTGQSDRAEITRPAATISRLAFSIAHAQAADDPICDEGSFVQQFVGAAKDFRTNNAEEEIWSVIAYSIEDFGDAKERASMLADRLNALQIDQPVSVGCRRPGNKYFPIVVGQQTTQTSAAEIKGVVESAGVLEQEPYLSNYKWRTSAFDAE